MLLQKQNSLGAFEGVHDVKTALGIHSDHDGRKNSGNNNNTSLSKDESILAQALEDWMLPWPRQNVESAGSTSATVPALM